MSDRCVEVDVPAGEADLASGLLWGIEGVVAIGERPTPDLDVVTLVVGVDAGTGAGTGEDPAVAVVAAAAGREWLARIVEVSDESWLDEWRAWAAPVRVGPILVQPTWVPSEAQRGDLVVLLDPGHAFGSGSHESTRLALATLPALVGPGTRVLDVGCGSGVLSLAAAALGAERVVAVDIDPEAVEVTTANAVRNGVDGAVTASTTPVGDVEGTFDLVLANIGAGVLADLVDDVAARVAPGGHLVLSGLLADQAAPTAAAYAGFEVVRTDELGEWAAVVLRASAVAYDG